MKETLETMVAAPRVLSKIEEWSIMDVQEAYRDDPADYFFTAVDNRIPDRWRPKEWRKACVDYLVASYTWYRRVPELASLRVCEFMAYRDTFEWMYTRIAPKMLKTSTIQDRGW